nr:fimbrillin family protein [Bacteroides intestinalis]
MKRTLILLLQAAAVLLLTAACQADLLTEQDETLIPDPSAPIELNGSAPIETEASGVVTRADGDRLSFKLYAVPSSSSTSWPAVPYINGVDATLASGSGTARAISFSPAAYWPVGRQSLKFIGVMKANEATTLNNGSVSLTAGQGENKDVLLSNNFTGNKSNHSGSMTFNRLMARLIVKPGADNKQVVTCDINGGSTGATYNVLTGATSNQSSTYTISYSTNSNSQTYYLIPGTTISELTNVVAGGTSKGTIQLTNGNGVNTSFTTAAGDSYTIEVTAEYAVLTIKTNNSIGWENGGDINLQ